MSVNLAVDPSGWRTGDVGRKPQTVAQVRKTGQLLAGTTERSPCLRRRRSGFRRVWVAKRSLPAGGRVVSFDQSVASMGSGGWSPVIMVVPVVATASPTLADPVPARVGRGRCAIAER